MNCQFPGGDFHLLLIGDSLAHKELVVIEDQPIFSFSGKLSIDRSKQLKFL